VRILSEDLSGKVGAYIVELVVYLESGLQRHSTNPARPGALDIL